MSVLRIPVRVMKMLNAPTVMVLTAVPVNKDSLEMVQLVMVSETFLAQIMSLFTRENRG